MANTKNSYLIFYRDAWRENVHGLSASPMSLSAAADLDWTSFALSLQAFETAYDLAKKGFTLEECKDLYLSSLESKNPRNDQRGEDR